MKYELWLSQDGGYSFFAVDNESARRMLNPEDQLVWIVEASSWEEASQAQYDYLGWGTYQPFEDSDRSKFDGVALLRRLWERISKVLKWAAES
jgi:hypothetical protein